MSNPDSNHANAVVEAFDLPQPFAGAVVLLETIAEHGCVSYLPDGSSSPNRDLCLLFAAELRRVATPRFAAVEEKLRQALAWGMVYGPMMSAATWDDMREKMVTQFMTSLRADLTAQSEADQPTKNYVTGDGKNVHITGNDAIAYVNSLETRIAQLTEVSWQSHLALKNAVTFVPWDEIDCPNTHRDVVEAVDQYEKVL